MIIKRHFAAVASLQQPAAMAPGRGLQCGGGQCCWGRHWALEASGGGSTHTRGSADVASRCAIFMAVPGGIQSQRMVRTGNGSRTAKRRR